MKELETLEDVREYLNGNPMLASVSYLLMSKIIGILIKERMSSEK